MQPDWEIWIDTNISPIIAKWMAESTGLISKSSYSLSWHYLTDKEIYEKAKAQGVYKLRIRRKQLTTMRPKFAILVLMFATFQSIFETFFSKLRTCDL